MPVREHGYEVGYGNTESVLSMRHGLVGFVWVVLMLRVTSLGSRLALKNKRYSRARERCIPVGTEYLKS